MIRRSNKTTEMKNPFLSLFAGLAAVGLLGGSLGYGMRRLSGGPAAVSDAEESEARSAGQGGRAAEEGPEAPGRREGAKLPEIPHRKSTETVESLLAGDPATSYGKVAAWLADAGEEEIAAFWAAYQGGKRTNDMTDLIMLNWTRVNPQGAIATLAGSKDEHYAWWAWAAHDPKKALAEAMANNPDRVNNVTWGIGEFHPEWLRENFDKLPEGARGNAMSGMRKWTDRQDPEGSLDFMKKHQMGLDRETFLSLVRKDPWAAQDWLKRNPATSDMRFSGEASLTDLMMATVARERPEDLERMVAATPAGEMRRKMEQTIYQQLVADDPEAALELARKGDVPLVKVDRLAEVGIKVMQKDPEQAFALAKEMLAAAGGKLGYETRVEYANGSSSWGTRQGKADELVEALFIKDPSRTLGLIELEEKEPTPQVFSNLVSRWGEEDLTGLSEWVNLQTDPKKRDPGASHVVRQLAERGEYAEALEWADSMSPSYRDSTMGNMIHQWATKDPDAMEQWLDDSTMAEEQKQGYREMLENIRESNR